MKKLLSLTVLAGLLVSSVALPAVAGRKPRKVTRAAQGTYQAPATVVGNCTQTDGIGCMTIATGPKESYVSGKVTDAHGQPVLINVSADLDGDTTTETDYGSFCGETTEPIKFDKGVALIFWVGPVVSTPARVTGGCVPGQGTQGTLDVTFSNLP